MLFKEGTFLIPWPAAGAVGHSDSLASHVVFKSKISAAYSAVHATRGDKLFFHFLYPVRNYLDSCLVRIPFEFSGTYALQQ